MSLLLANQGAAEVNVSGAVLEGSDAVAGALNHQVSLSGAVLEGSDAVAGNVSVVVSLSGAITEGSDVAAGTISVVVSVSGSVTEGSDVAAGTLAVAISVSGGMLEGSDAASGTIDVGVDVSGDVLEGSDSVDGTIEVVEGSTGARRRYSLRRKKKEYDFLSEIRQDLAEEMVAIDAQSSEDLTESTREQLSHNVVLASQKYKRLSELSNAYQVEIDSIDAALAFSEMRMQMLLDDEFMIILTIISANESHE